MPSLVRTALALVALTLASGCGGAAPVADPLSSRPAAPFLDSVGVGVHAGALDTSYADFATWSARLRALGVRHVRDALRLDDAEYVRRHLALADAGIRTSFIAIDPRVSAQRYVATVAGPLRRAADDIEGPNEPDGTLGPEWVALTRTFTEQLHAAWQATPALRGVPLAGPSFVDEGHAGAIPGSGRLWTFENLHSYPSGRPPETQLPADVAAVRRRAPRSPILVSETGYDDAPHATSGQPGVSEAAAAAYVPRAVLEGFAAGAQRTYVYELADERPDPAGQDPELHFGLLRSDLSPKPAYTALQRLMAAVRTSPGGGDRRPVALRGRADVRALLLDRADGSRALVLWRHVAVGAHPEPVGLHFDGQPDDLRVTPLLGPASTPPGERITVRLGAEPVVVSFR
jgi:hypothetical protein